MANLLQIATLIVAMVWWLTKATRSHATAPTNGAAPLALRLLALRLLALLLPPRDRDRFVGEVLANLADRERWWQRLDELLSVAGAMPGLAVILRWARRRRAERLAQPFVVVTMRFSARL
jgi:hypothetical protein